ncbi:hypothetical protein CRUP_013855 [Coryphaenoides rupestris]|nr:hypothetical protein CRUP_013855 [Coryphaenoides rupestris]
MAKRFLCSPAARSRRRLQFGAASFDVLSDVLINLNNRNKDKLNNLAVCSGYFKDQKVIECIFLMTQELGLDPLVGYCAIEILESNYQELMFEKLKVEFPLTMFSCVQIASKMWLHSDIVDNPAAVQFLHTMGHTVSKKTVMESELQILKGLDFKLNVPNPLTYVEILLEVLGHNEPSTPMEQLYHICVNVLQFACLQRTAIYESLLRVTTQSVSPSQEQREKFVTVSEDCMLLGVGVIAVAAVILNISNWEQVIAELSHITGISHRSIRDFSHGLFWQAHGHSFCLELLPLGGVPPRFHAQPCGYPSRQASDPAPLESWVSRTPESRMWWHQRIGWQSPRACGGSREERSQIPGVRTRQYSPVTGDRGVIPGICLGCSHPGAPLSGCQLKSSSRDQIPGQLAVPHPHIPIPVPVFIPHLRWPGHISEPGVDGVRGGGVRSPWSSEVLGGSPPAAITAAAAIIATAPDWQAAIAR